MNNEFGPINALPPKILSPWELYKAETSVRVTYPKNFKGFKVQANYEAFGTPSLGLHPGKFQSYIT